MKVILALFLILFGLVGLAMSLCGGVGMVAYSHQGGVPVGGALLVVGVIFVIIAVKAIQALFAPEPKHDALTPDVPPPVDPPP